MMSLAFASEIWHVWLFVLLIGPAYGASSPVLPSIIGDIFGVENYAKILGFTVVPGTLIWFGAPSAVGWLVDAYDSYFAAWIATALLAGLCAPLAFALSGKVYNRS
jgi:MFS family permease